MPKRNEACSEMLCHARHHNRTIKRFGDYIKKKGGQELGDRITGGRKRCAARMPMMVSCLRGLPGFDV
jgi:hypothetical protein